MDHYFLNKTYDDRHLLKLFVEQQDAKQMKATVMVRAQFL